MELVKYDAFVMPKVAYTTIKSISGVIPFLIADHKAKVLPCIQAGVFSRKGGFGLPKSGPGFPEAPEG